MSGVPVLYCPSASAIQFAPPPPPASTTTSHQHPLENPQITQIDPQTLHNLRQASHHLHASRLVAFPTETVYGLGANTLDPVAVKRVYELKGRPQDNPLIVHVSSLNMLRSLIPPPTTTTTTDEDDSQISDLYLSLINAFWPGPLTLLFPARHPANPPPAPQTLGIRLPAHPLARALITVANVPISAPSANSSGRPSPTRAEHVFADLGRRGAEPVSGGGGEEGMLGCILDAGACDVGVESTVLDGTLWSKTPRVGSTETRIVKVLRPGGVGVEEIERVVGALDDRLGFKGDQRTRVWVYGRDPPLSPSTLVPTPSISNTNIYSPRPQHHLPPQPPQRPPATQEINNPSTPGMKYKHYSPSVPVYLIYPTNTFPRSPLPFTPAAAAADGTAGEEGGTPAGLEDVVQSIARGVVAARLVQSSSSLSQPPALGSASASVNPASKPLIFGVMAFTDSPLARAFTLVSASSLPATLSEKSGERETTTTITTLLEGAGRQGQGGQKRETDIVVRVKEFGRTADDAARALFRDMLAFEGSSTITTTTGTETGTGTTRIPNDDTGLLSSSSSSTISNSEVLLRGGESAAGVDAIIIEACSEQGIGLAVMERVNKAVGGGGTGVGLTASGAGAGEKRFWVRV
ncbi:hypothetical protein QFC24_004354 [Naganishia onofrii]|uniref:Uncharacterized protein n=1 Tax=Naganishia onofrii TaxID=1851511 RepID=A0ACC2XFS8_9TREE|nr:hypothetical protein QFC24_004354 [Naganishia onofrii]